MAKKNGGTSRGPAKRASREDFKRILGELDEPTVIDLLEINPNVEELEEAAICLAGDQDVLAKSGHHVSLKAGRVVEAITATEEENASRRGNNIKAFP